MTALDTNLLVYALNRGSACRPVALQELRSLADGQQPWAIPWPCIYECLRVVSHPQAFRPPLPALDAWRQIRALCDSPYLHLLGETGRHAEIMGRVIEQSGATGNMVHDAHIWALCLEHGVSEMVSADRDMARFSGMKLRNPFAAA